METIEKTGGIIEAIETGKIQSQCASAGYLRQKRIENGEKIWIGQNKYVSKDADYDVKLHNYDPDIRNKQVEKLNVIKKERDNIRVNQCLAEIKKAAENTENIMPAILEAVKAYASIGEITGILRQVFGEYKEPRIV